MAEIDEEVVYGNQYYMVKANETNDGYTITNRITGVVEGGSEVLPSAVSKADVWSDLVKEIIQRLQG